MRPDFNKLLCERERIGAKVAKAFKKKKIKNEPKFIVDDDGEIDGGSTKLPLKGSLVSSKYLNENLSPLKKFLNSRVGQNWDNIYSEICSNLRKDKAINLHVFQHLFHYVEMNCKMSSDNKTVLYMSSNGWTPINSVQNLYRIVRYYIHPITKNLCLVNIPRKHKKYDWRWFHHPYDSKKMFHCDENGKWWEVIFEFIPHDEYIKTSKLNKQLVHQLYHHDDIFLKKEKNIPATMNVIHHGVQYKFLHINFINAFSLTRYWGDPKRAVSKIEMKMQDVKKYHLWDKKHKADKKYRENPRNPFV